MNLEYRSVLGLNVLSFLFNIISVFTPWIVYSATTPSKTILGQTFPGASNSGYLYLYESVGCTHKDYVLYTNEFKNVCSMIMIHDLPKPVSYITEASSYTLSFMCTVLIMNFISICLAYLRAVDIIVMIPEKLWCLKDEYLVIIITVLNALFQITSFGIYIGFMNSKFNMDIDAPLIGFQGTENKMWYYGGGFGLCITTFIFNLFVIILEIIAIRKVRTNDHTVVSITRNPLDNRHI
jgi:hypothetical protein